MIKKEKADTQSASETNSLTELIGQAMRRDGLLFPLSGEDARPAATNASEGQDEPIPASLHNPYAAVRRALSIPLAPEASIILILPFNTMSAEENGKYYLDMADAICSRLGDDYPCFSFRTLGAAVEEQSADALLDADFTVRGRAQLIGERIHATVELTSVRYQATVWNHKYNLDFHNIMLLEHQIGEDLLQVLNPGLKQKHKARASKRRRPDFEAYLKHKVGHGTWKESLRNYFYERGHDFWEKLTGDGLPAAIRSYRQAIDIDPQFAQAYASAADAYTYLGLLGLMPAAQAFAEGSKLARDACVRDRHFASVLSSLAFTDTFYEREWERAEQGFNDALVLNRDYPLARIGYAQLLTGLGRFDEALTQIAPALKQDVTPVSEVVRAMILFEARQYDLALAHLHAAKDRFRRSFDQIFYVLALNYAALGMFREAKDAARIAVTLSRRHWIKEALQVYVWAKAGESEKARDGLKELLKRRVKESKETDRPAVRSCVSPFHLSAIYVALAEQDEERRAKYRRKAFIRLAAGCAQKDQFMFLLAVDPRFDSVRSDSRFITLLREIRLEPLEIKA